jgi:hypothetical protein
LLQSSGFAVAKKTSNPIPPILHTISGWWYPTHLKNIKVSWDDEIPNIWNNKMFQTNQNMFLASSAGVVAMDWCFETTNSTNRELNDLKGTNRWCFETES